MKEYSYIGVVQELSNPDVKFLVRSTDCSICDGNIVLFRFDNWTIFAKVLHTAFLSIGSEEEAMLAEFGTIYDVEKIYAPTWEKKEEEKENGN